MKSNLKNEKFFLRLINKGLLKVTRSGQAWNLKTGKELAAQRDIAITGVYRKLSWQHPETKKIVQVQLHRIVWAHFKGVPSTDAVINHKDGNKQRCCLSNLESTTHEGNSKHAHRTGLIFHPRGDDKPNAKFTDSEVAKYRKKFALGLVRRTVIAKEKNTSIGVVSGMLQGKTYSHVISKYDSKCIEICKQSR